MKISSPISSLRAHIDLLEAAEYSGLLTESKRLDYLKTQYGAKLVDRFREEEAEGIPDFVKNAVMSETPSKDAATEDEALASKIISYIVSHDPSRNHSYSQWMMMRWLKKDIRLEDLTTINDNLEVFDQVKANLPVKDIGAYKTAFDLLAAVEPYLKVEAPISGKAEERRLAQRMNQEDQVEILYNNTDYKIVVPLTFEASNYYGRGTMWCTTSNKGDSRYYDHYSKQGPLFIIIEKETGNKWQFHFESGQFMDPRDRQITMKDFAKGHPRVMEILGDKRFVDHVEELGLEFFKPSTVSTMDAKQLAAGVNSVDDLKMLPPAAIQNPEVIVMICATMTRGDITIFRPKVKETVDWFQSAGASNETLTATIAINGNMIQYMPEWLKNDETKILALHAKKPADLDSIPMPWPEVVEAKNWENNVSRGRATLKNVIAADFPISPEIALAAFIANPKEINSYREFLTPDIIEPLLKATPVACLYLDANLLTEDMINDLASNASSIDNEQVELASKIDKSIWTSTFVKRFIDHFIIKKSDIPERLWIDTVIQKFMSANKTSFEGITKEDIEIATSYTTSMMYNAFRNRPERMKEIDPSFVNEDTLISLIGNDWRLYPSIPESMRSRDFVHFALGMNFIPVSQIPKESQTITNVASRLIFVMAQKISSPRPDINYQLTDTNTEFKEAIELFNKDDIVAELVRQSPGILEKIPEDYLTEKALNGLLTAEVRQYGYRNRELDKKNREALETRFARFPKETWSTRNVKLLLDKNLIDREVGEIPPKSIDPAIAKTICERNPAQWKKLPKRLKTSELLATLSKERPDIFAFVDPSMITEEMAYESMRTMGEYFDRNSGNRYYHGGLDNRKIINELPIPKDKWSQRMWDAIVGLFKGVELTDVPIAMRHHDLIATAISRNTDNVKALKDPAAWLNDNKKLMKDKIKLVSFMKSLEKSGVVRIAGGSFRNVDDVAREKLKSGWEVGISLVKGERRFYLYDDKGNNVLTFWTDNGVVKFPDYPKKEQREHLLEIVRKHLSDHELKGLNHLHVYGDKKNGVRTEEELERKPVPNTALTISIVPHVSENSAVLWSGNTAILRMNCEIRNFTKYTGPPSNRYATSEHSSEVTKLMYCDILNEKLAWDMGDDIFTYMKTISGGWRFPLSIGLLFFRDVLYNLRAKPAIAKVDGMDLYYIGTHVALFNGKKFVSWSMVKKNGEYSSSNNSWKWDSKDKQVETNLFYKLNVEPIIKAQMSISKK